MTEMAAEKTDLITGDSLKIVTEKEWEKVIMDILTLQRQTNAIAHATGVKRFDPLMCDYETGEDKEFLADFGFTDVYTETKQEITASEEKMTGMTKEKGQIIYEMLVAGQKKNSERGRIFSQKAKDIMTEFKVSRDTAIDWMDKTVLMYPGIVLKRKLDDGPNGVWVISLSDDEIRKVCHIDHVDTPYRP